MSSELKGGFPHEECRADATDKRLTVCDDENCDCHSMRVQETDEDWHWEYNPGDQGDGWDTGYIRVWN